MPKKTTAEIIASANDYIIQVKGNQKNLHKQIVLNTQQDNKAIDTFTESTNKRGRQEIRKTSIYTNLEGISDEWIGLRKIIRVERSVCTKKTKRSETAYYISSLQINKAEIFAGHIRSHWGIENRLHWVKDVSMKEDTSKTDKGMAAENISILRNVSITLFRIEGFDSIKAATQRYANDIEKLWNLIGANTKKKRT